MNSHLRKLIDETAVRDDVLNMVLEDRARIESRAAELKRQGMTSVQARAALDEEILKTKLKTFQAVSERRQAAEAVVAKARSTWEKAGADPQAEALRLRRLELGLRFLDKDELQARIQDEMNKDVHDPTEVQLLFATAQDKGVNGAWLDGHKGKLKASRYDQPWLQGEAAEAQRVIERYQGFAVGEVPVVQSGLNSGGVQIENHTRVSLDEILDL